MKVIESTPYVGKDGSGGREKESPKFVSTWPAALGKEFASRRKLADEKEKEAVDAKDDQKKVVEKNEEEKKEQVSIDTVDLQECLSDKKPEEELKDEETKDEKASIESKDEETKDEKTSKAIKMNSSFKPLLMPFHSKKTL